MRTVLMVLFDQVQSLDVTGPLEVFTGANTWRAGHGDAPSYDIRTASLGGRPVRTSSGLRVTPDEDLREFRVRRPDLLIVPGGEGSRRPDPELTGWLRSHGRQAERLVSVCTGAFLLAAAGLLDGRRVTTHWAYCASLAAKYPQVSVEQEPIFVRDGNVATSAGVTAGIDLALALVEDDLGRDAALDIARHLVVFLRRPGNQAQFSAQLAGQLANREPLREVQRWIADYPAADLSVETLARQASLSPRQFARAFAAEVGMPPGRYVDRVRLETARRRLEDTADGVEQTARSCGYGTPEAMRRAFIRALGVSPGEYRRRFRPPAISTSHQQLSHQQLTRRVMQIAILLFDRFTVLDAIGPYQVLSGLPGAEVSFVAERPGPIRDEEGSLVLSARAGLADVPRPDIIVVPGGPGQNDQMQDGPVHEWLRAADQATTWTTSVCTGSLILAAAGLLAGRRATSHWLALDELGQFGATPVTDRVVFDGKYVTAAGVSSGIDMGLALAGRIAGDQVAQAIQLMIEYDPQPPYDAGSPDRAPAEIVSRLRARSRFLLTGRQS